MNNENIPVIKNNDLTLENKDNKRKETMSTISEEIQLTGAKAKRFKKMSPELQERYKYRQQFEIYAKQRNIQEAVFLYKELMKNRKTLDISVLQIIINLCCDENAVYDNKETALHAFENIKKSSTASNKTMEETSYSAIIKIQSATGFTKEANDLLCEMKSLQIPTRLRTFSPLLAAYCKSNQLNEAFELREMMKIDSIEFTEVEYAALLHICFNMNESDKFYEVLEEFMSNIFKPKKSTWEILKLWFERQNLCISDEDKWKISIGKVDNNGICSLTTNQLESIELSNEEQKDFAQQVEALVCTSKKREEQWKEFKIWLETFKESPWDVIIDAANVGYYKQNFEGAIRVSFKQIDDMVNYYEEKKKKVLIFLHKRHFKSVAEESQKIIDNWLSREIVYSCHPGNNDDWYWLYAAIYFGGRTLVVTNDEMRDHHFQMLHNRLFSLWKERHQVHYDFKGFYKQYIHVNEPLVYSNRSQKLRNSWHFPNIDTDEWLCIYKEIKLN